jgi:hypothetical protein
LVFDEGTGRYIELKVNKLQIKPETKIDSEVRVNHRTASAK